MNTGNFYLLISIWLKTLFYIAKSDMATKCTVCKDMVENFKKQMVKTEKHGFGGGNTDWEESRLGTYSKSESRLLEILDEVCEKVSKESICHAMIEKHESDIYSWWYKGSKEQPDLEEYLCIKSIKVCCPANTYGSECKECPGGKQNSCNGHGDCQGAGTREGTGKCDCHSGYEGETCSECEDGYFDAGNSTCNACDESCKSTCTEAGSKGCDDCKVGWIKDQEEGCKDIDECVGDPCKESEYCVNTVGSYECKACHDSCKENCTGPDAISCNECKDGYVQDQSEGCKDVDECTQENICASGTFCQNTIGSYKCESCDKSCEFECSGAGNKACKACAHGYEMTEGECIDIDECSGKDGSSLCTVDGEYCKNTDGGFDCETCDVACEKCIAPGASGCTKCKNGFKMEDGRCTDVNECSMENSCKKETEKCQNTEGSYECLCKTGYKREAGKCVKGNKNVKKKKKNKNANKNQEDPLEKLVKDGQLFSEVHLKIGTLIYMCFFSMLYFLYRRGNWTGIAITVSAFAAGVVWFNKYFQNFDDSFAGTV